MNREFENNTAKGRQETLCETQIVDKYREIAFGTEAKDSDRLRALDRLADYLAKRQGADETLHRLDEILQSIGRKK